MAKEIGKIGTAEQQINSKGEREMILISNDFDIQNTNANKVINITSLKKS